MAGIEAGRRDSAEQMGFSCVCGTGNSRNRALKRRC